MQQKHRILVTGGTGYIGSHTVVELLNAGHEVLILDNLSNSDTSVLAGIEKITGKKPDFHPLDLCDLPALQKQLSAYPDIDSVIHFAASKAVGESVEKPLLYYKNNLLSLINLLEVFKDKEINFVFSSSCTVYGEPDVVPVSEQSPVKKAMSPYGNTKQIGEEILSDQAKISRLKVQILRYFNPVGAHFSGLIGELPLGVPNNLVPFITQTAIGKREKLRVFGNDYNTPDGSCIRDYIHVVDLATAHLKACERLWKKENKTAVEFFNIGTGKGNSVLEVIKAFEEVSEKKLPYEIADRRSGDVEQVFGDVRLAEKELKWKAQYGLKEMMESAWNWELQLSKNKH